MKRIHIVLILVSLIIAACTPKYFKPHHMENMRWIEGKWSATEAGITISESWKFTQRLGFDGINYIVAGKDTLFIERTQIRFGPKSSMVYDAKTGHVNFEASEQLKMVKFSKSSFTFQNQKATRRLTYKKKKGDVLEIEVLEMFDGELNKTKYELFKVNP